MKRTTISLPDDIALLLEREARRRETSVSEVTRRAVEAYLGHTPDGRRTLPFANLGSSGHQHTARDLEEILADEWNHPRDR